MFSGVACDVHLPSPTMGRAPGESSEQYLRIIMHISQLKCLFGMEEFNILSIICRIVLVPYHPFILCQLKTIF